MKKLKLIILLMLALLLVACGSATPSPSSDTTLKPGGDSTLKPGIEDVEKEEVEIEEVEIEDVEIEDVEIENVEKEKVKIEEDEIIVLDKNKKEAIKVLDKLPNKAENNKIVTYEKDKEGNENILVLGKTESPEKFKIDYKEVAYIHDDKWSFEVENISNYNLIINPNVHLIIDDNIIHKKPIHNDGHMYFIDDNVIDFTVTVPSFTNENNIYVIGKNGGSTLKIDGDYRAPSYYYDNGTKKLWSNLYLGLYARYDNTIATDKVLITGKVDGAGTNVIFVYNLDDLEYRKYPKAKVDDYVIRVEGHVSSPEQHFQMDNIQYGLSSYKLEASKNGKATEWKLKKK